MNHYQALSMLSPVRLGVDWDIAIRVDGESLDNAQSQVWVLWREVVPDTCQVLLSKWADLVGLSGSAAREDVVAAVRARGGLSKAYFESIAMALGFRIGMHAVVGDPHVRFVRGAFPAFRVGISHIGVDALWDQGPGASQWTVQVRGTDVESSVVARSVRLRDVLSDLVPAWVEVVYIDD